MRVVGRMAYLLMLRIFEFASEAFTNFAEDFQNTVCRNVRIYTIR